MKRSESRYIKIAEELKRRCIQPENHGCFIPSESALQKEFNTSRVTVRKALKLLEERGYLRIVPGRGRIADGIPLPIPLENRKRKNLACVYSPQTPCFGISANHFTFTARRNGYGCSVFFIELGTGIERFADTLTPEDFSGIVSIGNTSKEIAEKLYATGLPTVFIGQDMKSILDSFYTDNDSGGYIAAEHLVIHGHRNVAVFGPMLEENNEFIDRITGFQAAYRHSKQAYNISYINMSSPDYPDCLPEAINEITAVFVISDLYLEDFMELRKLSPEDIPQKLSIVGYDNFVNNYTPPPLHTDTIEQPWEEMASYAFEQLRSMIENPSEARHIKLKIRPLLKKYGTVSRI